MSKRLYAVFDESDSPFLPGERPYPRTEEDDIALVRLAESQGLEFKKESYLTKLQKELRQEM